MSTFGFCGWEMIIDDTRKGLHREFGGNEPRCPHGNPCVGLLLFECLCMTQTFFFENWKLNFETENCRPKLFLTKTFLKTSRIHFPSKNTRDTTTVAENLFGLSTIYKPKRCINFETIERKASHSKETNCLAAPRRSHCDDSYSTGTNPMAGWGKIKRRLHH